MWNVCFSSNRELSTYTYMYYSKFLGFYFYIQSCKEIYSNFIKKEWNQNKEKTYSFENGYL